MSQSPFFGESFPKVYSIRCRSHEQRSKCIDSSPPGHAFGSAACPLRLVSQLTKRPLSLAVPRRTAYIDSQRVRPDTLAFPAQDVVFKVKRNLRYSDGGYAHESIKIPGNLLLCVHKECGLCSEIYVSQSHRNLHHLTLERACYAA